MTPNAIVIPAVKLLIQPKRISLYPAVSGYLSNFKRGSLFIIHSSFRQQRRRCL
jgi:hypothetical protein